MLNCNTSALLGYVQTTGKSDPNPFFIHSSVNSTNSMESDLFWSTSICGPESDSGPIFYKGIYIFIKVFMRLLRHSIKILHKKIGFTPRILFFSCCLFVFAQAGQCPKDYWKYLSSSEFHHDWQFDINYHSIIVNSDAQKFRHPRIFSWKCIFFLWLKLFWRAETIALNGDI